MFRDARQRQGHIRSGARQTVKMTGAAAFGWAARMSKSTGEKAKQACEDFWVA